MLTDKLVNLKEKTDSGIKQEIINDLLELQDSEVIRNQMQETVNYGCATGVVPGMVYYKDTLPFYQRHKEEINQLLSSEVDATNMSLHELFENWDESDQLALEQHNQNILAWWAYEFMTQQIRQEVL